MRILTPGTQPYRLLRSFFLLLTILMLFISSQSGIIHEYTSLFIFLAIIFSGPAVFMEVFDANYRYEKELYENS